MNKSVKKFYPNKNSLDGLYSYCKDCKIKMSRDRYSIKKNSLKLIRQNTHRPGEKYCKYCNNWKSLEHFSYHQDHWDKLSHRCKECDRKYYKDAYHKRSYIQIEYDRKRSHNWYSKNKERKLSQYNSWRKRNPDKSRAIWHRYKARKLNVGGTMDGELLEKIRQYYSPNGKCLGCGKVKKLAYDHIHPLMLGGENSITNIQPLCRSCNSRKGSRTIIDYRPDKGEFARRLLSQ
jgi:5-methylcytosine-specific restriction endonuclease McrA